MVFIVVEKELGTHVQRMLEMSRCTYTGGNKMQNVWEKVEANWRKLKVYCAITALATYVVISGKC